MRHFTLKPVIFAAVIIIAPEFARAQEKPDIAALIKKAETQTDSTRCNTLNKIGILLNWRGSHDSAAIFFNEELRTAETARYIDGQFAALSGLGDVKMRLSQFDSAAVFFTRAKLVAQIEKSAKREAVAARALGAVYMMQGRNERALPYLEEAYKKVRETSDTGSMLLICADLGACYGGLGDTVKCLNLFETGLRLCEQAAASPALTPVLKSGLHSKKATLLYNMADFLTTDALVQRALARTELLWKDIQNNQAAPNGLVQKTTVNILADLYYRTGQYAKAAAYAQAALDKSEGGLDYSQFRDVYRTLAQSNGALGHYEKAYEYSLKYQQYSDSVYNYNKLEATRETEIKYENEKTEREMALLDREAKTQKKVNIIMLAALAVSAGMLLFAIRSKRLQRKLLQQQKLAGRKEMESRLLEMEQTALRAQMNPHFIFNCLNSVQRYAANGDATGINYYLATFAHLIRQTLENSGKQYIALQDEITYLNTYLKLEQMRSNNHFQYEINLPENIDIQRLQIPGMLIQPFVENSVLHGVMRLPKKIGKITVSFRANGVLLCTVEDNGPGVHAGMEWQKKALDSHQPMGTDITMRRIAAINQLQHEKISLCVEDRKDGPSTKVIISFPLITDDEN